MILTYFWAEDERNCDCSAELSPQESQEEFQVRSNVREYDCTEIDEKMRLISLVFLSKRLFLVKMYRDSSGLQATKPNKLPSNFEVTQFNLLKG